MTTIDLDELEKALKIQKENWDLSNEKTEYFMPGRDNIKTIHAAAAAYLQTMRQPGAEERESVLNDYDFHFSEMLAGRHHVLKPSTHIAIIAALKAQPSIPEGFKLVPVEPTDWMYDKAMNIIESMGWENFDRQDLLEIYRAMISAVPEHTE